VLLGQLLKGKKELRLPASKKAANGSTALAPASSTSSPVLASARGPGGALIRRVMPGSAVHAQSAASTS
jgi:hypothetical protein